MTVDFTEFENQFKIRCPHCSSERKGQMAVNEFGRPEAFFVYGQAQDTPTGLQWTSTWQSTHGSDIERS